MITPTIKPKSEIVMISNTNPTIVNANNNPTPTKYYKNRNQLLQPLTFL